MNRGIDERQEVDPSMLLRDTRTMGQRIHDFFKSPINITAVLVTMGGAVFFFPALTDIALILGICFFLYTYTRRSTLPFRLPLRAQMPDYNDLKPGSGKPNMSRGIAHFGNDRKTKEELWFNNEDMRTHVLIFGSTGSGKTETLVSLSYNALIQGSGFIYVDGKGDNTLFAKVFSMCRSMGREDDLLLINFMTGARDIVGPQEKRLSNTLNPFSTGSSSMLVQLVVSLMDSSSQSSDGDMWKGRAIAFVEGLMKILVYMRDQKAILLDANTIRNYFSLERLEAMVMDKVFIRDGAESLSLEEVPSVVLEPINNYLYTLPGYNKEKKGKQVSQVYEQHGFITMQLVRVFSSLADTYGHIIRTNLAEVDFKDVVLNRRILVVLLPALEKSPDELANLGKIIIASLKAMMAAGLGEEVEGEYHDIIARKPTNAPTPFMCILDEYGYYAVPGFAVVPAQARSLGFCAVFAGQDLPAFQKASKEEAASIGANTNIKICMKLEDPTETWEFFTKTAGEAYVTKVDSFATKETSVTNSYLDTKSSSFEKRARVDLLDLKEQKPGELHIFFQSRIIRATSFFANPPMCKQMRLNHFLKVEAPPDEELFELQQRTQNFQKILDRDDYFARVDAENHDITLISEALAKNEHLEPIERGVAALLSYHNYIEPEDEVDSFIEEESEDELNIFTGLRYSPDTEHLLLTERYQNFEAPLLDRTETRSEVGSIEKLTGRQSKHAASIATEIVKDMQIATHYPPDERDDIEADELSSLILNLNDRIESAIEEAKS